MYKIFKNTLAKFKKLNLTDWKDNSENLNNLSREPSKKKITILEKKEKKLSFIFV